MAEDSCKNCMTYRRGECLGKGLCEYYKPAPSLDNEDIKSWPKEFYYHRYREPKPEPQEYIEPVYVTRKKQKQRARILEEVDRERNKSQSSVSENISTAFSGDNKKMQKRSREEDISAIQNAYLKIKSKTEAADKLAESAVPLLGNKRLFLSESRLQPPSVEDLLDELRDKTIIWASCEIYNPGVYRARVLLQYNSHIKKMVSNVYFSSSGKALVEGVVRAVNCVNRPSTLYVITNVSLDSTMSPEEIKKNKWFRRLEDALLSKNSSLHEIVIDGYEKVIQKQISDPILFKRETSLLSINKADDKEMGSDVDDTHIHDETIQKHNDEKKNMEMNPELFAKANEVLKASLGEFAVFYEGQYEAIEAVLTKKRTLVVQRTGWGKSVVYFISAKMTDGITIVISPLLVLMDNQKELADRMGLRCRILNGRVKDEERNETFEMLLAGECDVLFTTPETLFKPDVQGIIPRLHIGLFVIDECHCISDWGHDFRLEYGMLVKVIQSLPANVSVLGTTATANDRVIADLKKQLGDDVFVSRGPLSRDGLHIEILHMESKAERYAWIEKNINKLPGTGIIYCLTQRDCKYLSDYLMGKGIEARPYYSGDGRDSEVNRFTNMTANDETMELFKNNRIKVIVATIKLGMGYDKEDIGFVIHFQCPSSLVAYYQQIGRAARKPGSQAYCFLMTGEEDRTIQEYFINNAFPTMEQEKAVVASLEDHSNGLGISQLLRYSNISRNSLIKCINFLMNQGIVYYEDRKYYRAPKAYEYQGQYYDSVRRAKREELEDLDNYIKEEGCLSKYVVNKLNDYTARRCGKCANCIGRSILDGLEIPTGEEIHSTQQLIDSRHMIIEPRLRWPESENDFDENAVISLPNEKGVALSQYGDAGYGAMVAHDKYHAEFYRKELVEKSAEVIKSSLRGANGFVVTNIPSQRNTKVAGLAKDIAALLGCEYMDCLVAESGAKQQKTMQNGFYQYRNAAAKIKIREDVTVTGNIILIDDMVDSRWTLTVAGCLLRKAGAESVFPFCLADSSQHEV